MLIQTDVSKGRICVPTAPQAGEVIVQRLTYAFPVAAAAADIIEFGILPARHYIVGLRVIKTGTFVEGSVGLLTGTPGDTVTARTLGANLTTAGISTDAAHLLAPVEFDRAIGITVATASAAGASVLMLQMTYAQG